MNQKSKKGLKIIKLLFESRQADIKLFNDYSVASEAIYKAKHGESLKKNIDFYWLLKKCFKDYQ